MSSGTDDQSTAATSSSQFLGLETSTLVTVIAILLATLYTVRQVYASRLYPPGPRGTPFLGYLDVLWSADKRKLLRDLRAEYGDVFSFTLGCRLVVVVSGFDTLKQMFGPQGSSCLDRLPIFAVTHGGQAKCAGGSSSEEAWQEHHQFTLNTLKNLSIGKHSFADKIQNELEAVCILLDGTKGADTDPAHVLHTAAANVVLAIAFGKRFDYDDPAFARFLGSFLENMSLSAGPALQHFFPFLRFLPGDVLQRQRMLKNGEHVQSHLRQWVDAAKRRFNPSDVGDLMDAYFKAMEEKKKKGGQSAGNFGYAQLQQMVGDLLVAGTEYTATTLRWLLVFLVRWPHVQRKLRQEIDSVYPDKATPSAQDRGRTPYLQATLLECQRFADVCPFALTRAVGQGKAEVMGGYQVPRGTLVVPNLHSLHHDPALWGDPENFRPERFLDEAGEVVRPEHLLPFSVGKQSCPGDELGQLELYLFLTTLLQRYEIRPAGQGKLPSLDGHIGIAYAPYSYKVRFVRRDQPEEEENDEKLEEEKEGMNNN